MSLKSPSFEDELLAAAVFVDRMLAVHHAEIDAVVFRGEELLVAEVRETLEIRVVHPSFRASKEVFTG
jgi:hypothetical protein